MAEKPVTNVTVLAVFPAAEDRTSLTNIFTDSDWNVQFTRDLAETQTALERSFVGVVMSDCRLSDGHCWKDLLNELEKMVSHPPLIVADHLADERLWAEVLNLGAYDLLAKPFDASEVLQAVKMACRRREKEHEILPRRKPAGSTLQAPAGEKRTNASHG